MPRNSVSPELTGRRVVVPGGTGAVGEGVVRAYLTAGADVIVPTRTRERAEEFLDVLGTVATDHLHVLVDDYTTFGAAATLADRVDQEFGGIDDVVAPIGGWWAGTSLSAVDQSDWQSAFVDLTTTHMAVVRAFLPRLAQSGAYTVVVGNSAVTPVPGSGLVSMEQAALLMMRRVLAAEAEGRQRVFAVVLGAVRTRLTDTGDPSQVSADDVGSVAAAASAAPSVAGREVWMSSRTDVAAALDLFLPARTDLPG